MALTDVVAQHVLKTLILPLMFSCLLGGVWWRYGEQMQTVYRAFVSDPVLDYNAALKKLKKDRLFAMSHHRSHDPDLRSRGLVRILEISSSATNTDFELFGTEYQMSVVERNAFFEPLFRKTREKFPGVKMEMDVIGTIENMEGVKDKHIDVVVATLVLCTAKNVDQALKEILRVLAPGGKFYYWEHVRDRPGTWLNAAQTMLFRVWLVLFDHHLNRDVDVIIEANHGFSVVRQKRFDIPSQQGVFKLIKVHVMGVATK